jgi:hypothetical protein
MKKARKTKEIYITNNSFSVLFNDLYIKIFSIINSKLTFRIPCFINKEFHTKMHLFGITNKLPFLTHIMRGVVPNYNESISMDQNYYQL